MNPSSNMLLESQVNDGVLPSSCLMRKWELSQTLKGLGLSEQSDVLVTNFYPPDDEYPSFFSDAPLPDAGGFTCIDSLEDVYGMSFLSRFEDTNADELRLSRQGTQPFLTATMGFGDGTTQDYTIVPKEWAREAFASKELHDEIGKLLLEPSGAATYFYTVHHAIPLVEKDPIGASITKSFLEDARQLRDVKELSQAIASFDAKAFEKKMPDRIGMSIEPLKELAKEDPWNVYTNIITDEPFRFACENGITFKDTALSKGIEKILKSCDFETVHTAIDPAMRGDKKALRELASLGKEMSR